MSACQQGSEKEDVALPQKISATANFRFLSLPSQRSKSVRYDIIIDHTNRHSLDDYLPIKARVYCFRDCPMHIEPETNYKANLFLTKADYPRNPTSFSYQDWLERQGLVYNGKLFANTMTAVNPGSGTVHGEFIAWLKEHLDRQDYGSHYLALLTGFRGPIEPDDVQVLVNTGTMHLLVVSGLHLGFIFILIFSLCRLFMPGASLLANVAGLSAMLSYAWLAGFSLATQRAFIMAVLAVIWFILGKRISPWYGWGVSLLLVLAISQPHVLDAGLWLSFGTVAILLFTFVRQNKQLGWIRSLIVSQWYIFPGICLLQVVFFDRFGFAPMVSNLIAIPFVGLVVLPVLLFSCLLLYAMPTLGHLLLDLLDWVFNPFWQTLIWLSDIPWSSLQIAGERTDYLPLIIVIASLSFLHLLPRSMPGKIWVWLFIPLLTLPVYGSRDAKAEIWLLESADDAHLLYIKQSYGLVVSLAQDEPVNIRSVSYDILPTLRYFDITHIDWTTLVRQSELREEDIIPLLRKDQTINIVSPCKTSSKHTQPEIDWYKIDDSCLMVISDSVNTFIFVPDIAITNLDAIEPLAKKAKIIYSLSSDSIDQLGKLDAINEDRECFVSKSWNKKQQTSLCEITALDKTGAVRIYTDNWKVERVYSGF